MHVVQRLHSSCRGRSANRDSVIKPPALDPSFRYTGRALDARIMCSDDFNCLLALLEARSHSVPQQNPAILTLVLMHNHCMSALQGAFEDFLSPTEHLGMAYTNATVARTLSRRRA